MSQIISFGTIGIVATIVLLLLFVFTLLVTQYRRCPSNRVLVVYGKVAGERAARCLHGGGTFIVPLLQSYAYLNLEPMTIEIELQSALSKKNIRVNVPSTFTIGISTNPDIMNNAAERLLGLNEQEIASQARDIILGQTRLVIATLSIEEINQDREKFLDLVNKNVSTEVNKIGLELINVTIRDITDESGYIEALGRKAASEAINTAKVEVAEADKAGQIGHATANREMTVQVAAQQAQAATGEKGAERSRRIAVAKLEAEGISGEADAQREQEVAIAEQQALSVQGKKQAEAEQRIKVAQLEAGAVEGENESKAQIADYEATLAERRAGRQAPWRGGTRGCVSRCTDRREGARASTAREGRDRQADDRTQADRDRRGGRGRAAPGGSPGARPMPSWPDTWPRPKASRRSSKPSRPATRS